MVVTWWIVGFFCAVTVINKVHGGKACSISDQTHLHAQEKGENKISHNNSEI